MVTVTDTAPIAGQNDEREQKSMNRETYETYSAAEPEKIDLIAFLAEYFQAFQKFFFGVLALVILAGGGSFLTAKLRYQPVYEAYTSFVVGSNRAVGYSYYDNVTAEQLGKTFPYLVTSGVLKDVVARDLGIGAVTSEIQASVMENTNLFTIRVRDASPETAYRVTLLSESKATMLIFRRPFSIKLEICSTASESVTSPSFASYAVTPDRSSTSSAWILTEISLLSIEISGPFPSFPVRCRIRHPPNASDEARNKIRTAALILCISF